MAKYVDGYVIPVPKKNLEKYKEMAVLANRIWKKYGALDYIECLGDDMDICKELGGLPFPKLMDLKDDEVVVFAFVIYKSKEDRERINKLAMEDPEMKESCGEEDNNARAPFNPKRMSMGGFEVIVE